MSWFRTIADSLRLDDDDEEEEEEDTNAGAAQSPLNPKPQDDQAQQPQSSSSPTARGVKEDLSEITKTLTTKFWGVASFLAPPSEPSSPPHISDPHPDHPDLSDWEPPEEAVIAGIRSDFAEISGRVKLGISKLSSNIGVSEISKFASDFLQIGSEEGSLEKYESVGVTEEVLAFVNDIAMHPETWLDFPVPDEDDQFGEFDMSDAQQEHALAVGHLVPSLAALRMELCPKYMSDDCFWKIYFVLLHPRLDKHVALLLSTPQIMEARALLTADLRNRTKAGLKGSTIVPSVPKEASTIPSVSEEASSSAPEERLSVSPSLEPESQPLQISAKEAMPPTVVSDSEMDKHTVQSSEIQVIDKSITDEKLVKQMIKHDHSSSEDENDEWLKEDISETVAANRTTAHIPNDDEDVSFSDFEDDDEDAPNIDGGSDSSAKDSRDWVQLGRSSTDSAKDININSADTKHPDRVSSNHEKKDSNDWLDVNDIDVI